MGRRELIISIALIVIIVAGGLIWQETQVKGYLREPYFQEKILFDTYVFIRAYGKNKRKVEKGVSRAFKEMERIDKLMSYYQTSSEISKVNREAGKKRVKVTEELLEMISLSKAYGEKTGDAFNIAIAPLMDLWSFGEKEHVPTSGELTSVLPLVDLEAVEIDRENGTVWFEKEGVKLDLGGVAKGYAVDKAVKILKSFGVSQALVSTGSSTSVLGAKPRGNSWKIGIKHPRRKGNKLLGVLSLRNKNVSTSGDYQQYFKRNNRLYHHILNPQTGLPAKGVISITVVTSRSATAADILSTALLVMGYPQGMEFLEREKDLEGIIVTSEGKVRVTSGLKGKVTNFPRKIESSPLP